MSTEQTPPSRYSVESPRPTQAHFSTGSGLDDHDEASASESSESRATRGDRFSWGNLLRIAGLGTIVSAAITALVSIATILTNWSTEIAKVEASDEDRKRQASIAIEEQRQQQQLKKQDRHDIGDARLRELRTKYVDMALGRQLCLDYRVRVFGYLAAVLDDSERIWAKAELERAISRRSRTDELEKQIDAAMAASLTDLAKNAIDQLKTSGAVTDTAVNVLEIARRTNDDKIKALQSQLVLAKAGDPVCQDDILDTEKKAAAPLKAPQPSSPTSR